MLNNHSFQHPCKKWLLSLVALFQMLTPVSHAGDEPVGCSDVGLRFETGVDLGTVYTLPHNHGFLELHPQQGLTVSNTRSVFRGPWHEAVLHVSGPTGTVVNLKLRLNDSPGKTGTRVQFVELIASTGAMTTRLEATGGVVRLPLVGRENVDGEVSTRLAIGALLSFRHGLYSQESQHELVATCLTVDRNSD